MKNPLQNLPVRAVRLAMVALAFIVPIAVAQSHNAVSAGGENCLKVECENGQITNACGQPVNFARCHAADDKGCLLLPVGRIQASETLPFACALGKLVRVSGCFPPFMPVSTSGIDHACLPDPKDPDALAASAGRVAPVPQAPAVAPAAAATAAAVAEAEAEAAETPELTEAEIRAQEQEAEAAMQKARDIALQASEANALSEESAAELRRLREKYDDGGGGGFLEATGQLLHGMAIVGAGYMASQGKLKEAKAMLESILKIKGTINEHTRQQAEGLLAQIEEAEAQQQEQQGEAEALTAQSMEALRGAPPPVGTATEESLREKDVWGGQLDVNARVNPEGWSRNYSHLSFAALKNDMEAARWLIANGAEVNAKGEGGSTPLHYAAFWNAAAVAKLLIDNGADVNVKTKYGSTPLDAAIQRGDSAMQSLLRQHGGRCNKEC